MKNKVYISIACFIIFIAILTTSSFAVSITEKTDGYKEGALIYGSTRFGTDVVITAAKAYDAGVNEAKLNVALGKDLSDIKPVVPYFYDGASWYQITESETEPAKPLTSTQVKEVEENLNIFFVNNEEKVVEVEYTGQVDSIDNKNVKYENGKFYVPVLTKFFTFISNNVTNEVETNTIESILKGEDVIENVEIVPEWATFEINGKYYGVDSVNEEFASGDDLKVKVLKDTDLKTAVVVSGKVTLNLNGKTLTAKNDTEGNGIFTVVTGGDLTINGEGIIDSACDTNDYSMAIWAKETGKVTINGGTFTNKGAKSVEDDGVTPNNNELIYARHSAQVVINGGTFIGNTDNKKYGATFTLNLKDAENETSSIVVKGGTFTGYNPANSASENPRMNFLADGYKVVSYEGEYVVAPVEEGDVVLVNGITYPSLPEAVANAPEGARIILLKDIDLKTGIIVSTKVTLELNGKTLTAKNDIEGNGIFTVVTGGNLTINGEGTIDSACDTNDYSMAIWAKETGKVTINGGIFTNKGAKSVEDDGVTPNNNELIYASGSGTVTINGGKFIGNTANETYGARYTLNLKDQDNQVASIVVKGGTFTGYDPANSKSENPTKNLVAEGYESNGSNDTYTVSEKAN